MHRIAAAYASTVDRPEVLAAYRVMITDAPAFLKPVDYYRRHAEEPMLRLILEELVGHPGLTCTPKDMPVSNIIALIDHALIWQRLIEGTPTDYAPPDRDRVAHQAAQTFLARFARPTER